MRRETGAAPCPCGSGRQVLHAILAVGIALLASPYVPREQEPEPPRICLVNLANNPRTASLFSRGVLEQHGSENTFSVVTPAQGCHSASERLLLVTQTQLTDWCQGREICILTGDEGCRGPSDGLAALHEFLVGVHLYAMVPEVVAAAYPPQVPSFEEADADDYFDELFDAAAETFSLHGARPATPETSALTTSERQRLALAEGISMLRPNVILREYYSSKYTIPAVVLGARYEFRRVTDRERDAGNRKCVSS